MLDLKGEHSLLAPCCCSRSSRRVLKLIVGGKEERKVSEIFQLVSPPDADY